MSEPTSIRSDKAIRSGFNNTGGGTALARGIGVKLEAGATQQNSIVAAAAATDLEYGVVADRDIPDQQWGDVQVKDKAICLSGAAVAVGAAVTVNASGKFVAAASGNRIWGKALTAAGATDELFEVELGSTGRLA
jgi:hypothetical protein